MSFNFACNIFLSATFLFNDLLFSCIYRTFISYVFSFIMMSENVETSSYFLMFLKISESFLAIFCSKIILLCQSRVSMQQVVIHWQNSQGMLPEVRLLFVLCV